jgi:hypothetical protein
MPSAHIAAHVSLLPTIEFYVVVLEPKGFLTLMIRNEVLQEAYKSGSLNVKFLRDGQARRGRRGEKEIFSFPSSSFSSFSPFLPLPALATSR